MKPEVLFLKYAFPCTFVIRQRGEITDEELKRLEEAAINNEVLPRMFLERVYFRAFERIDKLAHELGKERWDPAVIRDYFVHRHNDIIDKGMYSYAKAPESLKNLCKVHVATVKEVTGDVLVVEYGRGQRRPVSKDLIANVRAGDKVMIHYGYASEKL